MHTDIEIKNKVDFINQIMILIEHTKLFYFYAWLVPDSSMKNVIFKYFFSNLLSNTDITPMLFEEFYEIIGLAGYF